ncbi:chymotrypsin family serine protease [Zobellella maritima]|uniref:hypothetical protein n=1 Tax=Zobellella maritima TaxID=2059725 RepID=UPI0018E53930|nr:hypothetical protein [Zobellella maritima]
MTIWSSLLITPPVTADHTPISSHRTLSWELGTSGSSIEHQLDKGRVYCYTGTLGALVQDAEGVQYIISNNHVLAKENEPDNTLDADGNIIIQPGLLDEGPCSLSLGNMDNQVGYLTDYVPLLFGRGKNQPENSVDAAIARNDGMNTSGDILGIGGLSGNSVPAGNLELGLNVQKSGRTTGHTFGQLAAVDVTVNVGYSSGNALFTNQLEVIGSCMDFSAGGDSGSMIVTVPDDGNAGADAVGLLFAGGGSSTFANPIGEVLNAFPLGPLSMVASLSGTESEATTLGITDPASCSSDDDTNGSPGGPPPGKGKNKGSQHPAITHASQVARQYSAALLSVDGVHGHGIGLDAQGDPVIRLYMDTDARRPADTGKIPAIVEGVKVVVVPTGPIRAY